MLVELFLFLFVFSFACLTMSFFFEPKLFFAMVSMILFFFLAFNSGSIDKEYCEWDGLAWQCRTESMNDISLMALNSGFGLISLIYTAFYTLKAIKVKKK